ncbi:MAG: hypothetical protein LBT80_00090 [Lactobacillaceae bacterium]|jgi:hypothetical protein|nr:hypothetical protein [Lactobacillaceae bacterium]
MKKLIGLITAVLAVAFTGQFHGQATADSTPPTTGNGTASITVVAPTSDALYFVSVPNIVFPTEKIGDHTSNVNGQGDNQYRVVDLRGGSTGYTIQAQITAFTLVGGVKKLPVDNFLTTVKDGQNQAVTGTSDVDIYQAQGTVAVGNADANGTQTSGDISADMVLNPHSAMLGNGLYEATITHSLVTGV